MSDRVTQHGKQVKLDGRHFADAADETAAAAIVAAVNYIGLPRGEMPEQANHALMEALA